METDPRDPRAVLAQPQQAGAILQVRQARRHRIALALVGGVLAHVGRECRHVDQRTHLVVVAGFGDDGATPGMADQHDLARRCGDGSARGGDIVGKRSQRRFDGDGVNAPALQHGNDLVPARRIGERAVHERIAFERFMRRVLGRR